MEGSIPHSRRTLRTHGYVLRTNQLSRYLPDDDEYDLPSRDRSRVAIRIHGRLSHPYEAEAGRNRRATPTATPKTCPPHPRHARKTQPLPQAREVLLRTKRNRLPWSHSRKRQARNGPTKTKRRRRMASAMINRKFMNFSRYNA